MSDINISISEVTLYRYGGEDIKLDGYKRISATRDHQDGMFSVIVLDDAEVIADFLRIASAVVGRVAPVIGEQRDAADAADEAAKKAAEAEYLADLDASK